MVYCGKLSKACLPCRKRKLVCDLRKDRCGQCDRAQLTCSGYRDTEALRFRNESSAVRNKIQARTSIKTIPRSIPLSVYSQAKDAFYNNYVVGASKPLDFLLAFYSPTSKDELLDRSVDAVALAYLNWQQRSRIAEEEARKHYILALGLTSTALKTPDLARKDSTLLAILLLDLYEKISNKDPDFHGAWVAHLSGALTLVKLRGDQQFKDPNTLRMLMRLSTTLLISSVAGDRPLPAELVTFRSRIAAHFSTPSDPKWQESDLIIEYMSLQQKFMEGGLASDEALYALVELDFKLSRLAVNVPPSWQYKTILVDQKSTHHYELYHHVYPAEHVAQMWNTLRQTRIQLNEQIYARCLDCKGAPKNDPQAVALHLYARKTISEMISDICASVPQYIGDHPKSFQSSAMIITLGRDSSGGDSQIPGIGESNPTPYLPCYRLIFPLYAVTQFPSAPPPLKPWVIKQLRFIAEHHGIENAAAVARILESGEKRSFWLTYAMLGGYAFVC
ncbi:hypothetical protein MMC20_007998 [Loxospora ochrophaea]|nr:hypothetical protein [Loxospora ochrophaea]